jgi:DCN1-like protein 1/2
LGSSLIDLIDDFGFFCSRFVHLTETGELTAQNCLSQCGWKIDLAVDNYFSHPSRFQVAEARTQADRKKIDQLFQKYKEYDRERNGDLILVKGIIRLLEELRLPPDSIRILILAWKCEAKAQCEFRYRLPEGLSLPLSPCHLSNTLFSAAMNF